MASQRASLTGPTPVDWSRAERDPGTGNVRDNASKTDESTAIAGSVQTGVRQPAPSFSGVSGTGGRKVAGATRTKGGSI